MIATTIVESNGTNDKFYRNVAGLQISVGHRTMSDRNNGLSDSNRFLSDIVSERKNASILCIITLLKNIKNKNKTPVLYCCLSYR